MSIAEKARNMAQSPDNWLSRVAKEVAASHAELLEALRFFANIGIGENEDYRPTIRLPREAIIAARAAVDAATGEKP